MKAISLWQPYASLIAWKEKMIETRDWRPPESYERQRIAIHAAKRKITREETTAFLSHSEFLRAFARHGGMLHLPFGAVVATALLLRAIPTEEVRRYPGVYTNDRAAEFAFGDYSEGRWAWLLLDIHPLPTPIPAVGHQGFWEWNAEGVE